MTSGLGPDVPEPDPGNDSRDNPDTDGDPTEGAWREIVANFGEPSTDTTSGSTTTSSPASAWEPAYDAPPQAAHESPGDGTQSGSWSDTWSDEGRWIPPDPDVDLPWPGRLRFAAWLGVLGAPALFVVLTLLQVSVPQLISVLLLMWPVVGFGYLVATMSRHPRDPWDDGAQL